MAQTVEGVPALGEVPLGVAQTVEGVPALGWPLGGMSGVLGAAGPSTNPPAGDGSGGARLPDSLGTAAVPFFAAFRLD